MMRRLLLTGMVSVAVACPSLGGGQGGASAASAGGERQFTLQITGTEGASFDGECRVESAKGVQVIAIDGQAPLTREMTGYSLACRIEQTSSGGSLTVEVRKGDGSVSRSRTQGQGSRISMTVS